MAAAVAFAAASLPSPALAQVAVEAAVQTDYRVRGYSMSSGQPAASLSLSYDDASGLYLGGTVVGTIHHGDPELAGLQADAGYALRLGPGLSLDAGLSRSQYYYAYGDQRLHYTELYLGLATSHIRARVNYSPDYARAGMQTLYGELDGGIEPVAHWLLSAHAGLFRYLDTPPYRVPRERVDWRVGVTRQLGATGIHLNLSGRAQINPAGRASDATAVVLGVTHAF